MKRIFTAMLFAAAMMTATVAQAQIKFGLKGGLNVTNMSFSQDVADKSNRAGFFVGPTVKVGIPLAGLGVDAAVLYDQREAEAEGLTVKQRSINVPINLRYNIGFSSLVGAYIAAGPQFGFNIGDKHQTLVQDVSEWKLNTSNFSVNVGLGVMLLSHLQIGANYNIVCGKTGEVTVFDGAKEAFRGRSNTWQVSAAYYF